jgi:DNA repair ATPase RecN
MIQQQDSEEQLENYTDILSDDDIYQILMSQQQQLQDIGTVLRFIVESIQQKDSSVPDYRPFLVQMEKRLADSIQQQQTFQSTLEKHGKNIQEVDELTNSIQGMNRTLKNQSTSLQQYSNWKDIWQITFIGIMAGMFLLGGTYILNTLGDAKIEQKLDHLGSQNEKILKKVKVK